MNKKLLIIVPDRLSVFIQKGEVVPRYYNPGNLFDEVHIMMTNDDRPNPQLVQPMVGNARLVLHNFPPPEHFFRNTLGWQPFLIKKWIAQFLQTVLTINPKLIRTHNNFMEGYLASQAKQKLGIPYVTSLHGVWDIDDLITLKSRIHRIFRKKLEEITLKNADAVICVYSAILNYAKTHGSSNPYLIHNFVGGDYIAPKTTWELSRPIRFITVNRQLPEKNPENIIRALSLLKYDFEYTLIGDGQLHGYLKDLARTLRIYEKIEFIKSLPNKEVCSLYAQSDFMVSNCHYKGISKTIIEAGLAGLPVILNNYRDGYKLPEYEGDWICNCEDTPESYAGAITQLIQNASKRKSLGEKARTKATESFSSDALENKIASIYQTLLK
ncbi:MAG: glycosyltransferase [Proteobacteria bacterium]|nr:glycosyltransferase [Pseudomonadota bacterium]